MVDQVEQERFKTAEISFGTVFVLKNEIPDLDNKNRNVVIDIEEGDLFSAAKITEDKDGRHIFLPGTIKSSEFGYAVGQMSTEEVISALNLGWRKAGIGELKLSVVEEMFEYAKKGKRAIRIMDS